MTDITERLRQYGDGLPTGLMLMRNAADEIEHLRARVAELEAAHQKSAAIDKLARSMIRDWGRRDEAGYRFPDTVPLIISTRGG